MSRGTAETAAACSDRICGPDETWRRIAALLPRSGSVPDAVREAKRWLTEAIRRSDELSVGRGHGPVHHFHALWERR